MKPDQCTTEMEKRGIEKCKPINTFILSTADPIIAVCDGKGEPYKNTEMTISKERFDIVACKTNPNNPSPCPYSGKESKSRIIIKCDNGCPVHYHGDTDD
ncbi:uncharacterized protein V6R79_017925 [Siganus canaliculatus]